ncbi:MAG: DNA mismatch repair endonuclease MutL [Acidobacteria bacterium]|nr:MAG: DNA mismatch repair endonuclease MutL [Acidobacteriota bacterium]
MARVHVLPEVLAHKIAAGEIVERPASVVKELLENSLDARATMVVVEADNGGTKRITIRDDGIGMNPEDARTAFQHHATSKISTFDDLSRISTLGFRGEALPSIASVSRLRLRTVERGDTRNTPEPGTEIVFEGGNLQAVREIAWPAGTEVMVEDLFFNVPARRKFLKSIPTELTHVTRQVMSYALAYPHVEFQFTHQNRKLVEATRAGDLRERVYQIFGEEFLANLVELDLTADGIRIRGFTSLPHEQRSNAGSQFLYVNRRMVRDRTLSHAIRFAYQDLIPSSAYPVALLFVEVEPSEIDVNVHPCKTEIRFRDSSRVHSAIYHAIERALLQGRVDLSTVSRPIPGGQLQPVFGADSLPQVSSLGEQRPPDRCQLGGFRLSSPYQPSLPSGFGPGSAISALAAFSREPDPHGDNAIPETAHLTRSPIVLGQFIESFIVVAERDSLLLVDQHVAHERILFDRALKTMESGENVPQQRLLAPATVRLDPRQTAVFEHLAEELNRSGFDVDWFGAQTIVLKGVPAVAGHCDAQKLLEEILSSFNTREFQGDQAAEGLRRLKEKLAISIACRAAIKINTPLSREKMQWILDTLMLCEEPYTCPHGRPILLRMAIEDILRGFKRI